MFSKSDLNAMLGAVTEGGKPVVWTPQGRPAREIQGVIERRPFYTDAPDGSSEVGGQETVLHAALEAVSGAVRGDYYKIEGITYMGARPWSDGSGFAEIILTRAG